MKQTLNNWIEALKRYYTFAKIIRTQKRYERASNAWRDLTRDHNVLLRLDPNEVYEVFGHRVQLRTMERYIVGAGLTRAILEFNDREFRLTGNEIASILEPPKISGKKIMENADMSSVMHEIATRHVQTRTDIRLTSRKITQSPRLKAATDG